MSGSMIDPSLLMQPSTSLAPPQQQQQQQQQPADPDSAAGIIAAAQAQLAVPLEAHRSKKELEREAADLKLAELLDELQEFEPLIPDEAIDYYLQRSGFNTSDVRLKRLIALATQRFVSSLSSDAYAYARTRITSSARAAGQAQPGQGTSQPQGAQGQRRDRTKTTLTMEDLAAALQEWGINVGRAPYYL